MSVAKDHRHQGNRCAHEVRYVVFFKGLPPAQNSFFDCLLRSVSGWRGCQL